ncbi:MAG TPA: ABC transporter permease [Thermoanaerobaculia bacterium]|jgi:predicted permease|nr:ABC transporter permease [Thermoanaerobaculia bacterium]
MDAEARTSWAERAYASLLWLYPGSFREEYGGEMTAAFGARWAEARRTRRPVAAVWLWLSVAADALITALSEHRNRFAQDLAQAVRTLALSGNRAFTLASVATLALGLGGATTIFSLVHAVLLAPLPFVEPERVVRLAAANPSHDLPRFSVSVPDFLSWRENAKSFSALAGLGDVSVNLSGDGVASGVERVTGVAASANLFDLLGTPMVAGRAFTQEEDTPGGLAVAILGERLWRRRYGGQTSILGKSIRVNGEPRTVVGIAPGDVGFATDIGLWLPLSPQPSANRGNRQLYLVGRLAPGATLAAAGTELKGITARLEHDFPNTNLGWQATVEPVRDWIVGGELRTRLWVLLAAVGVLLLVACANVANLQLARATARVREIGIRRALGASPARVIRHLMIENLLLAGLGGALGLALAAAALRGASALLPATLPRLSSIALNGPVLVVAFLLTAATAFLFGVLPSALAGRTDVRTALAQGGRSAVEGRRAPLREGLVVAQLALATALSIGAVLLAQSFGRLQNVPLGFRPDHLLTARLTLPEAEDDQTMEKNLAFYGALMERVRALPGVTSAGLTSEIPLGEGDTSMGISAVAPPPGTSIEGGANREGTQASWRIVTAGYLPTLGVPLLRGRWFAEHDEPGQSLVLSEGLVRRLFPRGADPIGRRVYLANGKEFTVVGVAGDIRQIGLGEDMTPTMYFSTSWYLWPTMSLTVRTAGDPAALTPDIRRTLSQLAPDLALFDVRTLSTVIAGSVSQPRLQTWVVSLFAGLALLLAAIGIAGLVAYNVTRRTPELAVRAALGASPGRILKQVLARGLTLSLAGVVLGVLLAALLGTGLKSLLYGIDPHAPATYAATALILGTLGALAAWLPARRATRISPVLALKGE